MALVTISGYPCSGKSTRAKQLAAYFQKRLGEAGYEGPKLRVVLVDDEGSHVERAVYDGGSTRVHRSLSPRGGRDSGVPVTRCRPSACPTIDRRSCSEHRAQVVARLTTNSDSKVEKSGRANLFSAVLRSLGPDTILICDSLNYIKGFRYQMYCAAREAHARVCTVSGSTGPGLGWGEDWGWGWGWGRGCGRGCDA